MAHSYQFISSLGPTATVLLDLDNVNPFSIQKGTSLSPPKLQRSSAKGLRDGDLETGSSYMDRALRLDLKIEQVAAETQASALQTLGKILNDPAGAWLKWQSEGMAQPVFLRTKRADYAVVDDVLAASPIRSLSIPLVADPFAYGAEETQTVTITNDPTTGTNPMQAKLSAIKGDVETPLKISFATPDAAHRIVIASNSLVSGPTPPSVGDVFSRVNNTSSMGSTGLGGLTWTALAGTWGINGEQAYVQTAAGAGSYSLAYVDPGVADGTVEILMAASIPFSGLWLRGGATAATGYMLENDEVWRAGTVSVCTFSQTFVAGDRMRVTMFGNVFTIYRQAGGVGPWAVVGTFTDATYNSNTRFGLNIFGSTTTPRFDDFLFTPAAKVLPYKPYWRPFIAEPINTAPPTDWVISDVADANSVAGTVRRMNHNADTASQQTARPSLAVMSKWPGLPGGDYRPFARVHAMTAESLGFYNKAGGAAVAEANGLGSSVRDWMEMGHYSIGLPYGAPQADVAFGQVPTLPAAPYSTLVTMDEDDGDIAIGATDLDGLLMIPMSRPGLISRFMVLEFPDTYTSKRVTVDGFYETVDAIGLPTAAPTVQEFVRPDRIEGGTPVAVPGADNVLFFMATVASASATRVTDSKTTTTVLTITYNPRYLLADRPAAS